MLSVIRIIGAALYLTGFWLIVRYGYNFGIKHRKKLIKRPNLLGAMARLTPEPYWARLYAIPSLFCAYIGAGMIGQSAYITTWLIGIYTVFAVLIFTRPRR